MVELGLAEVIGEERFEGHGGWSYVYAAKGGPRWKKNQLKHDCLAFRVIVRLGLTFLNGDEVDADREPDFELFGDAGVRLFAEVDTGATPYWRLLEDRLPKYLPDDVVLWVSCGLWSTKDETRLKGLLGIAAGRPNHWFSTLHDVLKSGLQADVINCDGETKALTDLLTGLLPPSTAESPPEEEERQGLGA